MNHQDLTAIDIHTHAEVSCWNPFDAYGEEYDRAADKYFRFSNRPTIAVPACIAAASYGWSIQTRCIATTSP